MQKQKNEAKRHTQEIQQKQGGLETTVNLILRVVSSYILMSQICEKKGSVGKYVRREF